MVVVVVVVVFVVVVVLPLIVVVVVVVVVGLVVKRCSSMKKGYEWINMMTLVLHGVWYKTEEN